MKYKAAMFDFDGTITERGAVLPSQEMADALVKLAQRMPIAFCTGRQLESFENYGLNALIEEIEPKKLESFFENLYLIAENGSIGYAFNTDLDEFEEFYRAKWPGSFIDREKLKEMLREAIEKYGKPHKSKHYPSHRVVLVFTTKLAGFPPEEREIDEVYKLSDKIYDITLEALNGIDPNFEQFLHVGNSGIGVLVCPADGDKDNGIKKFAEFLNKERGISFDEQAREILVVGDMPQVGGNDHYFLKGDYGTPFTVGNLGENKDLPRPVVDSEGKRLFHSEGTLFLIKSILE